MKKQIFSDDPEVMKRLDNHIRKLSSAYTLSTIDLIHMQNCIILALISKYQISVDEFEKILADRSVSQDVIDLYFKIISPYIDEMKKNPINDKSNLEKG